MENSLWLWAGFNAFVLLLLALDLGVLHRKSRVIAVSEALWLSLFYIALALIFNAGVFYYLGNDKGYEFLTGYLIEKSLSIDNIFVIVLIFTHFAVPLQYQHRVLFWGIIGALIMRGALIYAGAALIDTFEWIVFVFGGFLVLTGLKMLTAAHQEPDMENNRIVSFARRNLGITDAYHGEKFFVKQAGKRLATPLFLALLMVEASDLIFAIDSIPAIFAVSKDPFIVYTSNVFAILGLRALYFALAGIIERFSYLKYALSLILIFVGGKMIANGLYPEEKVIPTEWALLVTATLIGGAILLSFIFPKRKEAAASISPGWVPGSPPKKPR